MYLQPRLKDLNSKSRSTSPFPSIRQPRGYNVQDPGRPVYELESGSSRGPLLSAGNSVGSWDMSMVSICFVCDVMLRHGL